MNKIFFLKFKFFLQRILKPNSRYDFIKKVVYFIRKIDKNKTIYILDTGCGNDSPLKIKTLVKNIFYVGIDVCLHNTKSPNEANMFILTKGELFSESILKIDKEFDIAICCHNLEHCNDWEKTLNAICKKIKKEGYLYLSFPSENSINFPSRKGKLNYYDDKTHKKDRPTLKRAERILKKNKFKIKLSYRNYSPLILRFIGFILEPFSKYLNKVLIGTWEYYGFETIIHAKKFVK